VYKRQLLGCS